MTQSSFVTQILEAEEKAQAEVEKARKKAQNDLAQYESQQAKKREDNLNKLREQSREQLKERQVAARKDYESAIEDGRREAATLEKDIAGKMDKHLGLAQAYFINELLG